MSIFVLNMKHIHISSIHIMQVYELNADKYNSNVEDAGATVAKRPHVPTLADAVQQQVTLTTFQIRIHYNPFSIFTFLLRILA